MKRMLVLLLLSAVVLSGGCGEAKTTFDANKQFDEETKKKMKAEDKSVEDEESHGTAGKTKAKKK